MPKWSDVVKSEEYQKARPDKRAFTKFRFWRNVASVSPKFTVLPREEQTKLRKQFFTVRPNEGIALKDFIRSGLREPIATKIIFPAFKKGDELAEKMATFIEGEVDPHRTMPEAIIKEFPRFMLAETVRMYKPSRVAVAYGIGKAIKPVARPVGRFFGRRIPEPVKKFFLREFTVGKGAPKAYVEAKEIGKLAKVAGAREAEDVAKILTTGEKGRILTIPEQRYIGRIFRKEVIESPVLKVHPRYQQLKSISDKGRVIMDKWSNELVKSGIPSKQAKETIEANVGRYMARMYRTKMVKTGKPFSFKSMRLRLDGLKHRKDLSQAVLKQLGEIKEPALPTAIRVKELSSSIADNKLFSFVSKNPEWVANTNITGRMIKMADSKALGALKNKWVIPEIGQDINAVIQARTQSLSRYMKALGAWKYGKVVLNPATHMRNMMSNSILLDLSGTNHIKQMQLMPKVMKDYLTRGKIYQLALKHGAIGGEFVGGDVAKIRAYYMTATGGNMNRWLNVLKAPFKKAGDAYRAEEQIAKMVKFTDMLERGFTPEIASKEAQKWLFDYTKIPNIIKLAKHGAPFITFTYKAIPRVAESIANNPLRVYKYYAAFNAWNQASRKTLTMPPEEFAREKKALPSWLLKSIGGMPSNLLMPWRDKYNRTQWLNLEYILPLGMAPEVLQRGVLRGFISNPVYNIIADLAKNEDFRGKDIIPAGATKAEATKIVTEYIYRQIAPSLAPAVGIKGGYSFEKIMSALQKRPDYMERTREITPVLFDVLAGLKLTPLDVEEAEKFKLFEKKKLVEELQKQFMRLQHPAISERERDKRTEDIFLKIERIMKNNGT